MKYLFILTLLLGVVSCQKDVVPPNSTQSLMLTDVQDSYTVVNVTNVDVLGNTSTINGSSLEVTIHNDSVDILYQGSLMETFIVTPIPCNIDSLRFVINGSNGDCVPYQISHDTLNVYYLRVPSNDINYCYREYKLLN